MQAFILLGAPGSGKGTVSAGLTKVSDLLHVSTGDMLRAALKAGTPVGLGAKKFIENGELVPDEVIIRLVEDHLDKVGEARFLFDGFPRTDVQAQMFDEALAKRDAAVNHVFLLDVPESVLVDRLSGRRICRSCGAVFHVRNIPPKVDGVCDHCGGELYQRPDDDGETVRNRLSVYRSQTQSLIDYYDQRGVLICVNATDRADTEQTILDAL